MEVFLANVSTLVGCWYVLTHFFKTTKANCALKSYKMSVRDNKRVVDFNNLTPFTNYTIFLERKSTLLEKSFQTSESGTSTVLFKNKLIFFCSTNTN